MQIKLCNELNIKPTDTVIFGQYQKTIKTLVIMIEVVYIEEFVYLSC